MFESGGYSRDDGYSRADGYSRGGDWDASIRGTYGRGSSDRRKRDSMGRYSRDDGYSRESRGKEASERMMQDTDDPTVKEALRQAVPVMENACRANVICNFICTSCLISLRFLQIRRN